MMPSLLRSGMRRIEVTAAVSTTGSPLSSRPLIGPLGGVTDSITGAPAGTAMYWSVNDAELPTLEIVTS
eukprot:3355945-Rhodomonas_salina.1